MTYLKINDTQYPAKVRDHARDTSWDLRQSKSITLEMSYEDAMTLFVDDLNWTVIYSDGNEYDHSEYCLAGPVSDNRNGTVTVKMGKPTSDELLAVIMGG